MTTDNPYLVMKPILSEEENTMIDNVTERFLALGWLEPQSGKLHYCSVTASFRQFQLRAIFNTRGVLVISAHWYEKPGAHPIQVLRWRDDAARAALYDADQLSTGAVSAIWRNYEDMSGDYRGGGVI